MAAGIMRKFKLTEISAVDRPAQGAALFAIAKRNGEALATGYVTKGAAIDDKLPDEVKAYAKRDFTQEQRDKDAASGAALPDGSFPIQSRKDLKNAIALVGHAADPAKAKAHIIARAKAIDATSLLPGDWKATKFVLDSLAKMDAAAIIDGLRDQIFSFESDLVAKGRSNDNCLPVLREYASILAADIDKSCAALRDVFDEVEKDDSIVEKSEPLQISKSQFMAHIKGIAPDVAKSAVFAAAMTEAGFEIDSAGALAKRETEMGFDIKKSLNLPATATEAEIEKAFATMQGGAKHGLAMLKMSGAHIAYLAKAKRLTKNPMSDEDCQKFAEKSEADRADYIKAHPIKKGDFPPSKDGEDDDEEDEDDMAKRAAADEVLKFDGQTIRKSVVGESQFGFMKAQAAKIQKMEDDAAKAGFNKRAENLEHIGKADDIGGLLFDISKAGGAELAEKVAKKFDQTEAVLAKSALFVEAGAAGAGGQFAKAVTEIDAKAAELMKADKKLSLAKARTLVRDQNPELAKREAEEAAAARKAAA